MIKFTYHHIFPETINNFLLKKGYSENNIYNLIRNKNITIDGKVVTSKNEKTSIFYSKVVVTLNEEFSTLPINNSSIKVIYEDDYFLVVDKPYDLDIEPTKANYVNNLAAMVNNYFISNNIKSKIHFVNRLDKLTSGLVIIAKNQYIHNVFSKVNIDKQYYALVEGEVENSGVIKVNIKRDGDSIKRIVAEDGKPCITKYNKVGYQKGMSLVNVKLLTGRTHQIRVSFAHIGHPLVSDPLYNPKTHSSLTMFLRAYSLKFRHPITKERIELKIK